MVVVQINLLMKELMIEEILVIRLKIMKQAKRMLLT